MRGGIAYPSKHVNLTKHILGLLIPSRSISWTEYLKTFYTKERMGWGYLVEEDMRSMCKTQNSVNPSTPPPNEKTGKIITQPHTNYYLPRVPYSCVQETKLRHRSSENNLMSNADRGHTIYAFKTKHPYNYKHLSRNSTGWAFFFSL